jgi:hypothetical protein
LQEVRIRVHADHERLAALDELHTLGRRLSFELGRAVTVFDVIRTAGDTGERERRQALVRSLRAH